MTLYGREREKHVHGRLFLYATYRREIDDYEAAAMCQTAKRNESGVRGSYVSDPTGRGGVMLACPPDKLREKIEWVEVIDDAWAECEMVDDGDAHGLAYLMEHNFCLTGEPHAREKNEECRKQICSACGISESTFYNRLRQITDIVSYHAARRRLI